MTENALKVIADFLARFYHEEPDDDEAVIRALERSAGHLEYRWVIAEAFRHILHAELPAGCLKDMVRHDANRFCRTDDEARKFLERTYLRNSFDTALNPRDLDA